MNILKVIPFIIACTLTSPVLSSDFGGLYDPPKTMGMQLVLKEATADKTTFRFNVMPLLGEAKNIKMTAKVIGSKALVPVPNSVSFKRLVKGQPATLEFSLPISKEKAMDKSLKIQGTVEYLPDYNEQIKAVNAKSETDYPNYPLRERMINQLIYNFDRKIKSVEIIRFLPAKK